MKKEVEELGVQSHRIKIINFGIDTKRFRKKSSGNCKDFGLCDKRLKVISLRDFEPVYDIESFVKSMPMILSLVPNTQFVLLGRGALKEDVKSMVKRMDLEGSVMFLDYVDNKKLPDLMSGVDVLVSTSLSDAGIAGSTAEAMSCELPVVITDSGENNLWIDNGKNGFLVPVSNPLELSSKVIELLNNEALRSKMGCNARETILYKNDYFKEMEKMHELYQYTGLRQ